MVGCERVRYVDGVTSLGALLTWSAVGVEAGALVDALVVSYSSFHTSSQDKTTRAGLIAAKEEALDARGELRQLVVRGRCAVELLVVFSITNRQFDCSCKEK